MKLTKGKILPNYQTLCQYLPHLSLIMSFIVVGFLVATSRLDMLYKASILLLSLVIISIILIKHRILFKTTSNLFRNIIFDRPFNQINLFKIYLIFALLTVIYLIFSPSRDEIFLLFIVLLFLVSIFHIFSKPWVGGKYILIELIITMCIFNWSTLYCYSFYYRSIDIYAHLYWVSGILGEGNITPLLIDGYYGNYNLYQIYIATTSLLTSMTPYASSYITAVPSLVTIIFIYYLSIYFTGSERCSAIAAFFYTCIPTFFKMSSTLMPLVPAAMAFILILYLLYHKWDTTRMQLCLWIVAGITIIFLTIVHHMSIIILFIVMALICILYWINVGRYNKTQIGILILFFTIPTLYAVYMILDYGISIFKMNWEKLMLEGGTISDMTTIASDGTMTFDTQYLLLSIASAIIIVLVLVGIYYLLLSPRSRKENIVLGAIALIMFVIFVPYVAEVSYVLSRLILVERWRVALLPFYAIVMAIGLTVFANIINQHTSRRNIAPIIAVILCLMFVVASPIIQGARDSDIFSNGELGTRLYLEDSDMNLYDFIYFSIPSGVDVWSDRTTIHYIENPFLTIAKLKDRPSYNGKSLSELLGESSIISSDYPYAIFCHMLYEKGYLYINYGTLGDLRMIPTQVITDTFNRNIYKHTTIYENGDTTVFWYS